MNITWISAASDNELDVTLAMSRCPDINFILYVLSDPLDKHNDYHMNMLTRAPNVTINEINSSYIDNICQELVTKSNDLIVFRHPTWIPNDARAKEICNILKNQPVVCTTWEWVPNYAMAQMPPLAGWKRIAVTNSQDFIRAKASYPDKQILTLPFGVVPRTEGELQPHNEYRSDLMCDAQPHYECKEFNGVKRNSVDIMIGPAIDNNDYKLALWGSRYGDTGLCDWGSTSRFVPFVRGSFNTPDYPKVYSSTKLYLGVSWNYCHGGFSIRLSRALSCGIPVIWHKTEGGEIDIPEKVLEWSDSYDTTQKFINYYLDPKNERKRLEFGKKGRRWALDNWEWSKLLRKLAKEIS